MSQARYDSARLKQLDVAHHLQPHQDYKLIQNMGGSRIITRAEGCYIYDSDGNALLDAMAGLWCVQVGYGRKELADAARDQMVELPFYNTFFKTVAPSTVMLAAKVAELLGGNLSHVFFNNSGSEAIDTVIRMVRYYWQVKGKPERHVIIARKNAYHGSTIAGTSLGGMAAMHKQGGPWVPGIEHVMQPYSFNEGFGESAEAFAERAANAVEERISAGRAGKSRRVHRRAGARRGRRDHSAGGLLARIEAICRKYGILLICDEVICGFGRLGKWFGFQHFGIKPDLVSMAKGLSSGYLPISAVGVSAPIVETLRGAGEFIHGYTYSGHPTCAAVALKNIEIIEREKLVERTANETGPHLARRLAEIGRSSAGGRGAFPRFDRRHRNRLEERHEPALRRQGRQGGADRPRHLHQERPDGARRARHHRHEPAAGDHARGDRQHVRHPAQGDGGSAAGTEGAGIAQLNPVRA